MSPKKSSRSSISRRSRATRRRARRSPIDPLRFRGNAYVEDWPAWHEFDLIGRDLTIGATRLKVVKRIVRCAATNVDPDTAARDMNIPQTLMQTFGQADCGVYAEVIAGGTIGPGDAVEA